MYNRILVPLDGSPTSGRGVQETVKLAKLKSARLQLVGVVKEIVFATATSDSYDECGFMGSDAEQIVRQASMPVLLVRDYEVAAVHAR